jgi:hypothetical protein
MQLPQMSKKFLLKNNWLLPEQRLSIAMNLHSHVLPFLTIPDPPPFYTLPNFYTTVIDRKKVE